jgi:uncharacterized membrane protein YqjE
LHALRRRRANNNTGAPDSKKAETMALMHEENKPLAPAERAAETLPSLFGRLSDQITELFDAKLALLRTELKEEINVYLRGAIMIVSGIVVLVIGFALLNVAIAFLVAMAFESMHMSQPARYALGFFITAVLYLVAGTVVVVKAKNRIAKQGIVPPRTAHELERDKEWLQKQTQHQQSNLRN